MWNHLWGELSITCVLLSQISCFSGPGFFTELIWWWILEDSSSRMETLTSFPRFCVGSRLWIPPGIQNFVKCKWAEMKTFTWCFTRDFLIWKLTKILQTNSGVYFSLCRDKRDKHTLQICSEDAPPWRNYLTKPESTTWPGEHAEHGVFVCK